MPNTLPSPTFARRHQGSTWRRATPELIAVWAEAYGELADALIKAEKALCADARTAPGKLQALKVAAVKEESAAIKFFAIEALPGEQLPAFKPRTVCQRIRPFPCWANAIAAVQPVGGAESPVPAHFRQTRGK